MNKKQTTIAQHVIEQAKEDNPELPESFIADSLASIKEPREKATPFIPRSKNESQISTSFGSLQSPNESPFPKGKS